MEGYDTQQNELSFFYFIFRISLLPQFSHVVPKEYWNAHQHEWYEGWKNFLERV